MKNLAQLIDAKPDQIAEGELAALVPTLPGQSHPFPAGTPGIRHKQDCLCIAAKLTMDGICLTMRRPNGSTFDFCPH
jgi:hypothetical protein